MQGTSDCNVRFCDCQQLRWMYRAETVGEGPNEGEVCVGSPGDGHRPVVRGAAGQCFICRLLSLDTATQVADAILSEDGEAPGREMREKAFQEMVELSEESGASGDLREICRECQHVWDLHGDNGCFLRDCDCPAGAQLLVPCGACGHRERLHPGGKCRYVGCRCGWPEPEPLPPVSLNPLPGYRVVYALHGGQQYELDVPGDASVAVIDGQVRIFHPGRPALGVTAVITSPVLSGGEVSSDPEHEGDGR